VAFLSQFKVSSTGLFISGFNANFTLFFCGQLRHTEMGLAPAIHFVLGFDWLWLAFLSWFEVSGSGLFISGCNADFTLFFLQLNQTSEM
jgi:hypothetical protein